MYEAAATYVQREGGDLFWGTVTEVDGVYVAQALPQKLLLLTETVRLIPSEELDWRTEDWLAGQFRMSKVEMSKLLTGEGTPNYPSGKRSYGYKYATEETLRMALKWLIAEHEHPAAIVHTMYRNHNAMTAVDERKLALGNAALRHFYFEVGGELALQALRDAS